MALWSVNAKWEDLIGWLSDRSMKSWTILLGSVNDKVDDPRRWLCGRFMKKLMILLNGFVFDQCKSIRSDWVALRLVSEKIRHGSTQVSNIFMF